MRNVIPKNARLVPDGAKRVFKGVIYDVYHWPQKMFDGSFETFEMLKRPDTVKVIAIKDDKIVMLDQEQPDSGPFFDLPGGRHDHESETELEAAKREVREETGMIFSKWKLVSVSQPHVKIDQFVYIFIAYDYENQIEPELDNGEKITVKLMSLSDVKDLCRSPKARFLPKEILDRVEAISELVVLPEFSGQSNMINS